MRPRTSASSLLCVLPVLSGFSAAMGFSCKDIVVDGYKYDLSPLGGVHTIYHVDETEEYMTNTTYVLNLCNRLGKAATRGTLKCGQYKRICGFQYKDALDGSGETDIPIPIAGLDALDHGNMDPQLTRLKKLDAEEEGLQLKLGGGEYQKKPTSAVIRFECDPDRSGLEGLEETTTGGEGEEESDSQLDRRYTIHTTTTTATTSQESGESDNNGSNPSRSLQFKSFGPADEKSYVLKLNWKTRYACDNYLKDRKEADSSASGHWGFFTWFIILAFLCIAAYLIFGSWLNYNRYGARGWDLLPHGDTIRDVPYIFQDWFRRVVNTLQGSGGSRGGYSAV